MNVLIISKIFTVTLKHAYCVSVLTVGWRWTDKIQKKLGNKANPRTYLDMYKSKYTYMYVYYLAYLL